MESGRGLDCTVAGYGQCCFVSSSCSSHSSVVCCTFEQWFRPYSLHRLYCHLPVSGSKNRQMACTLLHFRLGCHGLPIAAGCFAGADHVDRAHRVWLACNSDAEKHLVFECTAHASLRSWYACVFTHSTDNLRSLFAQPGHMGILLLLRSRLSIFHDDLSMIAMIGTSLLLPLPTQLASLEFMAGMLAWCVGCSCVTG